jgi:hypothetical protein
MRILVENGTRMGRFMEIISMSMGTISSSQQLPQK